MLTNRNALKVPIGTFNGERAPESHEDTFVYLFHQRAKRIYELCGSPKYLDMNGVDTAVLHAFNMFADKKNATAIFPTTETLVRMTGFSRRTVERSLVKLVASGLLKRLPDSPGRPYYWFGPALLEKPTEGGWRERLAGKQRHTDVAGKARKRTDSVRGTQGQRQTGTVDSVGGAHVNVGVTQSPCRSDVENLSSPTVSDNDNLPTEPMSTETPPLDVSLRSTSGAATPPLSCEDGSREDAVVEADGRTDTLVPTDTPSIPQTDDEIRAFFASAYLPSSRH